jgi:membrane protein DedA with SNARE-associated domain
MDIIHTVVDWYMANLNYFSVMLLMTVESSFIPFPSEVVVPFAAFKAAEGELNIFLVVLFSSLGAMLGAFINYYLALWLGRPIVYKFAESTLGKMCLLSREKVEYAEKYFVKHGKASTFIGRLVPAVRQLISIPAGLSRMRIRDFTVYTLAGAYDMERYSGGHRLFYVFHERYHLPFFEGDNDFYWCSVCSVFGLQRIKGKKK